MVPGVSWFTWHRAGKSHPKEGTKLVFSIVHDGFFFSSRCCYFFLIIKCFCNLKCFDFGHLNFCHIFGYPGFLRPTIPPLVGSCCQSCWVTWEERIAVLRFLVLSGHRALSRAQEDLGSSWPVSCKVLRTCRFVTESLFVYFCLRLSVSIAVLHWHCWKRQTNESN